MSEIDRAVRADAEDRMVAGMRSVVPRASGRQRSVLLVISGVALVAAILGAALFIARRHDAAAPSSGEGSRGRSAAAALIGVPWADPHSPGTVVFTDTTANIFDGCSSGLQSVVLRSHDLTLGKPIGAQSTCSRPSGPQPTASQKFDRVMQGRLRWSVSGRTLVLTTSSGESLTLVGAAGAASAVVGTNWQLVRIVDRTGQELTGSFSRADFSIRNGQVSANDLCNGIDGTAQVSPTTITFGDLQHTLIGCPSTRKAQIVINDVLSGTITFTIRGGELILYGRDNEMLVYTPKR